jgi:hypothetical protein
MPTPEPMPLDRLPHESSEAHEAFIVYAELGASRDHAAVSTQLAKSPSLIRRWSSKWGWTDRARQHDNQRQRIIEEACEKVIAKRSAVWESRRVDVAEERFTTAKKMAAHVLAMLDYPLVKTRIREYNAEGVAVTIEHNPVKWTLATCATLARVAAELQNAAINEFMDDDDFDVQNATENECRSYLERQALRRKARRGG